MKGLEFMKIFGTTVTTEELNDYFEEKEILYREFKSKEKVFLNCKYEDFTKKENSYNAEKKTIIIYVPKTEIFELARKLADIRIKNLIEGYDIETKEDFEEYKEVFVDYAFTANEFMNCLKEKEYVDKEYIAVVKEFKEKMKENKHNNETNLKGTDFMTKEKLKRRITELENSYRELETMLSHSDEYLKQAKYYEPYCNEWGYLSYEVENKMCGEELVNYLKYKLDKIKQAIKKQQKRLSEIE